MTEHAANAATAADSSKARHAVERPNVVVHVHDGHVYVYAHDKAGRLVRAYEHPSSRDRGDLENLAMRIHEAPGDDRVNIDRTDERQQAYIAGLEAVLREGR